MSGLPFSLLGWIVIARREELVLGEVGLIVGKVSGYGLNGKLIAHESEVVGYRNWIIYFL